MNRLIEDLNRQALESLSALFLKEEHLVTTPKTWGVLEVDQEGVARLVRIIPLGDRVVFRRPHAFLAGGA